MPTPQKNKNLPGDISVTRGEHSTVTIEGELPYAELEKHRNAALAALGADISVDGFRKGHVPEAVLIQKIGDMALLSEMAERALADVYPQILAHHAIDAIGRPNISITKLAPDNPLGFTARVAVMPDITLPDYRAIARTTEKEDAIVTDDMLEEAILDIQRQKRAYERMQRKAAHTENATTNDLTLPTPETVQGENDDEPLPQLTDEYVKTLGDFDSVDTFKKKLREHLEIEKQRETAAKHRATITDRIIEEASVELPQVLVDSEMHQMLGQMEHDLARANLTMADYLSHIGKTKEDLTAEWKPAAEKRAKLQLILNEIARKEGVTVPDDAIEREASALMTQHPDANPQQVRLYVTSMLTNEATMQLLEKESAQT